MAKIIHRDANNIKYFAELALERAEAIYVGVFVASVRRDVAHQTQPRRDGTPHGCAIDGDERREDITVDRSTVFSSPERGNIARGSVERRVQLPHAGDESNHSQRSQDPRAKRRRRGARAREGRRRRRRWPRRGAARLDVGRHRVPAERTKARQRVPQCRANRTAKCYRRTRGGARARGGAHPLVPKWPWRWRATMTTTTRGGSGKMR